MTDQLLGPRHQRVQRLRRLARQRTARRQEGRFVVEGSKLIGEALDAGAVVEAVFYAPAASSSSGVGALLERARARGARVLALREGVLERVTDTVTPQPVCAVAAARDVPLDELVAEEATGLLPVVVCVDVRDPGNVGAILRSAGAAGTAGVVVCGESADVYNPKVVRASAGAIFRVPLALADDPPGVLERLGAAGLRRVGTRSAGGEDYAAAALDAPCALVFGNEATGLPRSLAGLLDAEVTIPMAGGESLNVAMAATVLCFEAARRRAASGEAEGASGRHLR